MRIAMAALLVGLAVRAEEPGISVRSELLVVQVPLSYAIRLAPRLRGPRLQAAVEEIRAKVAKGEVHLVAAPVTLSHNGQRAVSETIEEVRHSTEFYVHSIPQNFGKVPAPSPPSFVPGLIRDTQRWSRPLLDIPRQFETRNAGGSLEVEAHVEENKRTIRLAVVAQDVTFQGMRRLLKTPARANDQLFAQPEFRAFKTTTEITVDSGDWVFLHRAIVLRDRCELFFLRATAIRPPA